MINYGRRAPSGRREVHLYLLLMGVMVFFEPHVLFFSSGSPRQISSVESCDDTAYNVNLSAVRVSTCGGSFL